MLSVYIPPLRLVLWCLLVSGVRAPDYITSPGPQFQDRVRVAVVTSPSIVEASGMCASRSHPDVLYTQNDSGDTNRIYAISAINGSLLATITANGSTNWDWEDMACGPCAGGLGHCVYIADTGGNYKDHVENKIYRIPEPKSIHDQTLHVDSVLQFSWNESDCETVLVDPFGEVYLVSKVKQGRARLYHLPATAWGAEQRTPLGDGVYLPMSTPDGPTAGDLSTDGKELLLKTYTNVFLWYFEGGNLTAAMANTPTEQPYIREQQGESLCFNRNSSGYYTLSEGAQPTLYLYRRVSGSNGLHAQDGYRSTLAIASIIVSVVVVRN